MSEPAAINPEEILGSVSIQRRRKDAAGRAALLAGTLIALVPLVLIVFFLLKKGLGAWSLHFFTTDPTGNFFGDQGGIRSAIVGTLMIMLLGGLLAIPAGIAVALYVTEYADKNAFGRFMRFLMNVMTGVPSIVMGLFIYVTWTLQFGYSAFGGALALACLMLPVVIGSTEQMLKLVPNHLREASYAVGTSKSRTILTVVLPAAMPGIISGSLLAVARAAGETAPLLFATGAATEYNPNLFVEANTALSLQIFGNATSSFVAAQDRAWGAALTLVLLTFFITLIARFVTARFARRR